MFQIEARDKRKEEQREEQSGEGANKRATWFSGAVWLPPNYRIVFTSIYVRSDGSLN